MKAQAAQQQTLTSDRSIMVRLNPVKRPRTQWSQFCSKHRNKLSLCPDIWIQGCCQPAEHAHTLQIPPKREDWLQQSQVMSEWEVKMSALHTCVNMIGCYQLQSCEWANHCEAYCIELILCLLLSVYWRLANNFKMYTATCCPYHINLPCFLNSSH